MFTKTILVLAAAASALGQQINTPATLTTCVPAALTWTGGQSPYYLSVLPGGQASGTPLESFGEQTGTSYTWTVNLAAGQAITLALTDSTGKTVYSDQVTIMSGTSTSCVNGTSSGGAASSGASSMSSMAMSSASSMASGASSSASGAKASVTSAASSVKSAASSGASSAAASATSAASSAGKGVAVIGAGSLAGLLLAAAGAVMA